MEGSFEHHNDGPGYLPSTPTDWGFDKSWERVLVLAGGKEAAFVLLTCVDIYVYTCASLLH